MSSRKYNTGAIVFMLATAVQAAVSLLFVVLNPSEDQNAFLLGYSLSRLLFAAVFLILITVCLFGIASVWTHKTSLLDSLKQKVEQPGRLALVFVGLLIFILFSAMSLIIATSFAGGTEIVRFTALSFENLQINLKSLLLPLQDSWISLIPLFKWCLVFGVDAFFYMVWAGNQTNTDPQTGTHKAWQKYIASGFSAIFLVVTTILVYFPSNQPLILRFSENMDWLILLIMFACLGLLIILMNYQPRSIQFFATGLLALGVMLNFVDHSYSAAQNSLVQKPDHTLESLASSKDYLLRPYLICHMLSEEYGGREIQINQAIMDRFSLSEERLVTMGRLSKVTILDSEMVLDQESTDQLTKLPNTRIRMPLNDSDEPADTEWVFITPGSEDFEVVQIRPSGNGKFYIIPITPGMPLWWKDQ